MKFTPFLLLLLPVILLCACNTASNSDRDVTNDYVVITTAIRTSKASRLQFQEKMAVALDSFLVKDEAMVDINGINQLLQTAAQENLKAIALVEAANEIDSSLLYKAKALGMFKLMDEQYKTVYPAIVSTMTGAAKNKKYSIGKLLVPATEALRVQAKDVINTAAAVVKKYNIQLVEVANP